MESTDSLSPAVRSLLATMFDEEEWLGNRITAADALLAYELPEGVSEGVKAFLTDRVLSDAETDAPLKTKAALIIRRVEDRKVTPSSVTTVEPFSGMADKMEAARAKRRSTADFQRWGSNNE